MKRTSEEPPQERDWSGSGGGGIWKHLKTGGSLSNCRKRQQRPLDDTPPEVVCALRGCVLYSSPVNSAGTAFYHIAALASLCTFRISEPDLDLHASLKAVLANWAVKAAHIIFPKCANQAKDRHS